MTSWVPASLANHLWQSTLVVAFVWLVTLALRRHDARVRYWLWAAASVKFFLPFSWLIGLGALVEWRTAPAIAQPAAAFVMDEVLAPPLLTTVVGAPGARETSLVPWVLGGVWAAGCLVVLLRWWRDWMPIRAARRAATPLSLGADFDTTGLRVLSSSSSFEPGVVGIWRPVLLVPGRLLDRLTPPQLRALLAHERCHVRSHDNLFAAVHMLVEAMFWFHPLSWWIERRLIDERERACDEDVLRSGSSPDAYAEGILEVCRASVPSSMACVAGVTGSDLRRRIESILRDDQGRPLTAAGRIALMCAAGVIVCTPIVAGALSAGPQAQARPQFEVASVKRNTSGLPGNRFLPSPGRLSARATLKMLIWYAYQIDDFRIVGGQPWLDSDQYEIDARAPGATLEAIRGPMLQRLLEDRFQLVTHRETSDIPVFVLRAARGGAKLQMTKEGSCLMREPDAPPVPGRQQAEYCGFAGFGGTTLRATGIQMDTLVRLLSMHLRRVVVDETGITGMFNVALDFTPDDTVIGVPPSGGAPPTFFTAIQEQLGLRLEAARRPGEILVIDRAELPEEN